MLDYLNRHPSGDHCLESVAAVAGASPYHFHRIFHTITGETLANASRRIRLQRATTLMKSHAGRPLGMIALDAGFGSHSEFSRAFRRWFGIAPSAWDRRSRLSPLPEATHADWEGPSIEDLIAQDTGGPVRGMRVRLPRVRLVYVRVAQPYVPGALAAGWDRLQEWMAKHDVPFPASGLVGTSWDDVHSVPLDQLRYDLAIEVDPETPAWDGVGFHDLPAMPALSAHAVGNLSRVARVWDHLYRVSLPACRADPADWPAQERYRTVPDFQREDAWDLDCVIPLR